MGCNFSVCSYASAFPPTGYVSSNSILFAISFKSLPILVSWLVGLPGLGEGRKKVAERELTIVTLGGPGRHYNSFFIGLLFMHSFRCALKWSPKPFYPDTVIFLLPTVGSQFAVLHKQSDSHRKKFSITRGYQAILESYWVCQPSSFLLLFPTPLLARV